MRFIWTEVRGIIRYALVLVPLLAAIAGYLFGLHTAVHLSNGDRGQLAGYFTTVATVLAALVVGLVFSAIFADPSDGVTPALRWIAVWLAAALIACCAGLVPDRSAAFTEQCFAVSAAGGAASLLGLFLLVVRARGGRSSLEAWARALRAAQPLDDDDKRSRH